MMQSNKNGASSQLAADSWQEAGGMEHGAYSKNSEVRGRKIQDARCRMQTRFRISDLTTRSQAFDPFDPSTGSGQAELRAG